MSLQVELRHRLGALTLDAAFAADGGVTALFGASGAGKTSIVRAIAGLLRPEHGRVVVDGEVLLDTQQRRWLPPHRRRIGYVFQEPRLLPHLTVGGNLGYGRWFARDRVASGDAARLIELLDLQPLLQRMPARLSGGEQQRVAIGRALLAAPRLLLMDEPLSQIDAARKAEILPYLERLRDELRTPMVLVSHALPEVARLATTIVAVDAGRVLASGPVATMLSRVDLPILSRNADAGSVFEAQLVGHDAAHGLSTLRFSGGELRLPQLAQPLGATLRVWIRARDVMLARGDVASLKASLSALNVLPARIVHIGAAHEASVELQLDCGGTPLLARLTYLSLERLQLAPGDQLAAIIKTVALDPQALLG